MRTEKAVAGTDTILTEALHQVREGADHEMRSAREAYQAQMEAFHQTKENEGTEEK
ncbi:MAG: hypothetical protein ACI3YK_03085 [Eubacteriales bacterium]